MDDINYKFVFLGHNLQKKKIKPRPSLSPLKHGLKKRTKFSKFPIVALAKENASYSKEGIDVFDEEPAQLSLNEMKTPADYTNILVVRAPSKPDNIKSSWSGFIPITDHNVDDLCIRSKRQNSYTSIPSRSNSQLSSTLATSEHLSEKDSLNMTNNHGFTVERHIPQPLILNQKGKWVLKNDLIRATASSSLLSFEDQVKFYNNHDTIKHTIVLKIYNITLFKVSLEIFDEGDDEEQQMIVNDLIDRMWQEFDPSLLPNTREDYRVYIYWFLSKILHCC